MAAVRDAEQQRWRAAVEDSAALRGHLEAVRAEAAEARGRLQVGCQRLFPIILPFITIHMQRPKGGLYLEAKLNHDHNDALVGRSSSQGRGRGKGGCREGA